MHLENAGGVLCVFRAAMTNIHVHYGKNMEQW